MSFSGTQSFQETFFFDSKLRDKEAHKIFFQLGLIGLSLHRRNGTAFLCYIMMDVSQHQLTGKV